MSYKPTDSMKTEAQRGLDWRKEHGRGGTEVGIARARDITNNKNLSESTVKRMYSYFSRHEVDKQADGFSPGEDGYPSNGRIAWALWGGDAGFSWSKRIVNKLKNEDRAAPDALSVGDFVSWDNPGGRARGKITKIARDGKINVPNSELTITGTPDDPAALIRLYRGGEPTDTEVGHKFSTLTKINPIRVSDSLDEFEKHPVVNTEEKTMLKEDRHILNVNETDDSIVIEFSKNHEDVEESTDNVDEERPYHDEDERFDSNDITYRIADISRADKIDEENRRVRVGVSSEEPVEREFGTEVLSHDEGDIDMKFVSSGRAPLLLDHDMTKQIGVIEKYELDPAAKRTIAVVRFGKGPLADEVFRDVVDGIRQNISVGYKINGMERDSNRKDKPVYRVKSTPLEVSIVSVPADQSEAVGVGRSESKSVNKMEKDMTEEVKSSKEEINVSEVRSKAAEEVKAEFMKNSKEIMDLAARHNKKDLADEAIKKGLSVEEFRGVLLENIGGVYTMTQSGGELIVLPTMEVGLLGSSQFDVDQCFEALIKHKPESIILLPNMLEAMVNYLHLHPRDTSFLKFIAVGGAKTSKNLLELPTMGITIILKFLISQKIDVALSCNLYEEVSLKKINFAYRISIILLLYRLIY